MSPLEIVKSFYAADVANDTEVVSKYFHPDAELHWTSSQGFRILNYEDLVIFFAETRKAFDNLRFEFTHLIESNSTVVTRHTLFGSAIEDSKNETVLGHFSTKVWRLIRKNKYKKGLVYTFQNPYFCTEIFKNQKNNTIT